MAILAMAYYKLDDRKKAEEFRSQLKEAMKLDAFKDDEECKSFLIEVNSLFDRDTDD